MDKLCKVCGENAVIFFGGGDAYCRKHALTEKRVGCFYCGERATAYVEAALKDHELLPCCDRHKQEESREERREIEQERRNMEEHFNEYES